MQVTYLLHLRVVLVLTMVQSRPHHLKHQWSQISTWVSLNHIRHHTYFKSSYVHIQVSHILHHHNMKLLLAFKSFQRRRPIIEIGSENWFAAGCQFGSEAGFLQAANSSAKTGSLQAANLAVKTGSMQPTQFRQRITNSLQNMSFSSECQFTMADIVSAVNHNFAAEHPIRQQMLFRCRQLSFGSEY